MVCPNCGTQIKRFDLSPNCKKCGIHIMYFTQERDLARDAKKTELEFAKARALVARIKAAYIGGKLPIMRLVFLVLSIGALVIPYGSISIGLPYYSQEISVGAIGAYNLVSSGFYSKLMSLGSLGIAEKPGQLTFIWVVLFVLAVLAVVGMLVAYLLAFIKLQRGHKALAVLSGIAIVFNAAAAVMPFLITKEAANYSFISAKNGFGAFVSIAVLAVFFAVNVIMFNRNAQPIIKDVDVKRIELASKVKKGEVQLDDLPVPIFETEEEKQARLNALAGIKKEKKKKGKKKKEEENVNG